MSLAKPLDGRAFGQWLADSVGRIDETKTELIFGGRTYVRIFLVRSWPEEVSLAQFDRLLHFHDHNPAHHRISMRVVDRLVPGTIEWNWFMRMKLKRVKATNLEKQHGDGSQLVDRDELGVEAGLVQMYQACELERRAAFQLWRFIAIRADSLILLHEAEQQLRDVAQGLGITITHLPGQQLEALGEIHVLGMPNRRLYHEWPGRWAHSAALAPLYPCTIGSGADRKGAYFGNRVADGLFIIHDLAQGSGNRNVLVVGAAGEGKSTLMKALVADLLLQGYRVYVYDLEHEYRQLCEEAGGRYIDQSAASGHFYDPVRMPRRCGDAEADAARYTQTCQHVHAVLSLLLDGLDPDEETAADEALLATWRAAGVDPEDQTTWDRAEARQASFHRWYEFLQQAAEAAGHQSAEARLAKKLFRFFEGTLKHLFSRPADIAELEQAQLTVIHIGRDASDGTGDRIATVKMQLANREVLGAVRRHKVEGVKSAVVQDELQSFLRNPHASRATHTLAVEIRKRDGILVGAANELSVFSETDGGKAFWDNSAYKALFWLEDSAIQAVEGKSLLPPPVIERLRTLFQTHSYILRYGQYDWELVHLDLPPQEVALYKTRGN